MDKIVFATNNQHKLAEIRAMLKGKFEVIGLEELGCFDEIPETADTLEGNASQKSHYIYSRYHVNCFADDTGLEVDALEGEPGVFSARYAGEHRDATDNMNKLLTELKNKNNRKAQFKTVIALHFNGKLETFTGLCEGEITTKKRGESGFGYDPIFKPKNYEITFAEMDLNLKNSIGHRGKAVSKLIAFLNQ